MAKVLSKKTTLGPGDMEFNLNITNIIKNFYKAIQKKNYNALMTKKKVFSCTVIFQ